MQNDRFPALVAFTHPTRGDMAYANLFGTLCTKMEDASPVRTEEEAEERISRVQRICGAYAYWGLIPVQSGIVYWTTVESETDPERRAYTVTEDAAHGWACGCPDHLFRRRDCKHIMVAKARKVQALKRTA